MELDLYSLLFLTFIIFILLSLIKLAEVSNTQKTKRTLPPGPWQLPVIGSLHHFLGSGVPPHRCLRDLSRIHGPVMHLKLGEISTIVVSSSDAAREIMKTHDVNFASRPIFNAVRVISYGGQTVVFAPYGAFWRKMRKICFFELLSPQRVRSFESIREEEVLALIRSISSTTDPTVVNLTRSITTLPNDIVTRAVMGSKCTEQAAFLSALDEAVEVAAGFDLAELYPSFPIVSYFTGLGRKLERIHRKLDHFLDGIIREHEERRAAVKSGGDDLLLDALLRLLREGGSPVGNVPLTTGALKSVILDMFAAGSESSANTLIWAMTELVRNPKVMKKAQSEIRGLFGEKKKNQEENIVLVEADFAKLSYLKLVIKEVLRLHAPTPLIPRECRRTCDLLGYEIPEKAKVLLNVWAICRDPQYWGDDAEEFKPERFDGSEIDYKGADFEFLPFGGGRRICPGISFGVANVEHALIQLLYYFDWELPEGARLDMAESFGAAARKKSDLCLKAIPHIPCPPLV